MAENTQNSISPHKETIVLLHGWGVNAAIFEPVSAHLSNNFNVICIDLPGFGDNVDNYPSTYNLQTIATQMVEQIPDNSIVMGWSLGGLVASTLALQYPTKVNKLITVASSPCFVAKENWLGIKPDVLAMFHQQLEGDISKTLSGFLKLQAMGSPHVREDIRLIKKLVEQKQQPTKFVLDRGLDILAHEDLRKQLIEIAQPFLRIYGKLDGLVPYKVINEINTLAPNSKHHIIAKASHAPFISHQVEFIEILSSWLKSNRS